MNSEVWDCPINQTEDPDIESLIPQQASFTVNHDKLKLKVSQGEVVEYLTKSGLFQTPLESQSTESIAIEGTLHTFFKHSETGLVANL